MSRGYIRHAPRPKLWPSLAMDTPSRYSDQPSYRELQDLRCSRSDSRYALYLPRNLSFCTLCSDAVKEHLARKVALLDQTLTDIGYSGFVGKLKKDNSDVVSEASDWLSDESDSTTPDLLSPEGSSFTASPVDQRDLSLQPGRSESASPRRLSSILRKGKAKSFPPPPRSTKKVVRFADSLGLELETVRHLMFRDFPPYVPSRAFADLHHFQSSMELEAEFSNPGSLVDFDVRLRKQSVLLHSVRSYYTTVYGLVSVLNITYHKWITVRYTMNAWRSHCDTRASYVPKSSDSKSSDVDQFQFTIFASPKDFLGRQMKLSFAVCYRTEDDQEHWDNNGGQNYSMIAFYKQSPSETSSARSWVHFL